MKKRTKRIKSKANAMRKAIIEMLFEAGSGHPGGSLSATDIIACLYFDVMKHNSKDPDWDQRDRFHLSKGHCCPAVYAALGISGYFSTHNFKKLRKLGGMLQGHSDRRVPGIEVSSGSLGQGLSVALGMALAGRLDNKDYRVYCLMGDGEIQEGNIWEAAMAAANFRVDNLCGIIDFNGFQIDGRTEEIMDLEPLVNKWESFGWHVIQCDGHNIEELLYAFNQAKMIKMKPSVIIARTVKGKGVSFMEHVVDFHGRAPVKKEKEIALMELKSIEEDESKL